MSVVNIRIISRSSCTWSDSNDTPPPITAPQISRWIFIAMIILPFIIVSSLSVGSTSNSWLKMKHDNNQAKCQSVSHTIYPGNICFKVTKQGHVIKPEVYNKECLFTYPSSKNPNVIQTGMWRILKGTGSRSSAECCWYNKSNTRHCHVSSHIAKNREESYVHVQVQTEYFWPALKCLEIFTDWTGHSVLQIHAAAVNTRICNDVGN